MTYYAGSGISFSILFAVLLCDNLACLVPGFAATTGVVKLDIKDTHGMSHLWAYSVFVWERLSIGLDIVGLPAISILNS
jgi:hypothetical protein